MIHNNKYGRLLFIVFISGLPNNKLSEVYIENSSFMLTQAPPPDQSAAMQLNLRHWTVWERFSQSYNLRVPIFQLQLNFFVGLHAQW